MRPKKVITSKKKLPQNKKASVSKRDRLSTEDKLIKAGMAVFSKYGYDAATTKLISSKSGVNESLIMRYFGGKEGLLLEILRRFFEKNRNTSLPYPPQETLEEEVIQYNRASHQVMAQDNEVIRIMLLRASVNAAVRKKVLEMLPLEGDPKLIERINLLKTKKKIPASIDPALIALIGFQNFASVFISGYLFNEDMHECIKADLEKLTLATLSGLLKK